jgi:hypothetical protein
MSQNNTEHWIHNIENSAYQEIKPCVMKEWELLGLWQNWSSSIKTLCNYLRATESSFSLSASQQIQIWCSEPWNFTRISRLLVKPKDITVLTKRSTNHTDPSVQSSFCKLSYNLWGTRWRIWFRHCATSRKVAGSIPDGVTGIFPSGRTMGWLNLWQKWAPIIFPEG